MSRSGEKIHRQLPDDASTVDPLSELESSAKAQLEQLLSKRLANHQAVQAASQAPKETVILQVSQLAQYVPTHAMVSASVLHTAVCPGEGQIFPQAPSLSVAALCTD